MSTNRKINLILLSSIHFVFSSVEMQKRPNYATRFLNLPKWLLRKTFSPMYVFFVPYDNRETLFLKSLSLS